MKKHFKYLFLSIGLAYAITSCKVKDKSPSDTKADVVAFNDYKSKSLEELVSEYFKEHQEDLGDSSKLVTVANRFLAINSGSEEFGNKKPIKIQPIYAYGIEGVAYYEVWFTEDEKTIKGWILISATDKDYPLVNFSMGIPYSSRILDGDKNSKVYRFGVSYYALEKNGQKVADYGQIPKYVTNSEIDNGDGAVADSKDPNSVLNSGKVEPKEGVDYFLVEDYAALKELFPKHYFSEKRKNTAKSFETSLFSSNAHKQGRTSAYQYRYTGGSQAYYTQIPANSGFNPFACWSGCNNNAWTNIYGWWDRNASKGALIPTTSTGEVSPLYRNTAARRNSIDPVQMYIRSVSSTYCGSGTGWTLWSNTWKGYQYAPYKGYGYSYQYQWCNSAGCNVALANILTDGVANNYKPVYIGANSHAYVGYGWCQWDTNTDWTWAYCYPGWSENNNDDVWIWWHDFNAAVKIFVY